MLYAYHIEQQSTLLIKEKTLNKRVSFFVSKNIPKKNRLISLKFVVTRQANRHITVITREVKNRQMQFCDFSSNNVGVDAYDIGY